jgi:hypothetical protein
LAALEDGTKKLQDHVTERRFAALEDSHRRLEITQTDRNLRSMSIVFGAMTILITVTGLVVAVLTWGSRTETRQATQEMEAKVEKAIAKMDQRFELLAGDALKKPSLQLLWDQQPLDSQVIEIPMPNVSPMTFSLQHFFLTNSGDRRTGPISLSLLMAGRFTRGIFENTDWEAAPSSDSGYSVSFNSTRANTTVAAKQMLNVHPLEVTIMDNMLWGTNVPCKMQVFYDGDRPAEARFQLKLKLH